MDEYTRDDYIDAVAALYMELFEEREKANRTSRALSEERANVNRLSARVRELEEKYGKASE